MKLIIFTDGGARGNPGPAATGVVIKNIKGETVAAFGEYLGEQTNNYAEYSAFISALKKAEKLGAEEVECFMDSKLVCEQVNGHWKVREPALQKLFVVAWNQTRKFKKITIKHIAREKNKEADFQVNKILDEKKF